MPIYEYLCGACGHQLEALQKMTDAPLTDCPACHKLKLTKLVSAAGFELKGTGWYATDFKNKGKPEVKSDNKPDSKLDSQSDNKLDNKPGNSSTDDTNKSDRNSLGNTKRDIQSAESKAT